MKIYDRVSARVGPQVRVGVVGIARDCGAADAADAANANAPVDLIDLFIHF